MQKIDKLLTLAKAANSRKEHKEIDKVLARMTTDQLRELTNDDLSDERLKEVFASVDGLHLLESG